MGSQGPENGTETLTWTVWPAAKRPAQAAGLAAMAALVAAFCSVSFGGIAYGMVAFAVVLAAGAPFLFPSTYTIDDQGIRVRGILWRKSRTWDQLACHLRGPHFIAVSTQAEPTHRSISDGLILRLAENGDEVEAALSRHIPRWERPSGAQ